MAAIQPDLIGAHWHPGDEIHKARVEAHLRQNELAELIGVSRQLVSKWERSIGEPTITQFRAIARVTNARWLLQQALKLKLLNGDGQMQLGETRATLDIVR